MGVHTLVVHRAAVSSPPLLYGQVAEAVADLRTGRHRVDWAMFWWTLPWNWFKATLVQLTLYFIGPRAVTAARFLFVVQLGVASAQSYDQGRAWLIPGMILLLSDQLCSFVQRWRVRHPRPARPAGVAVAA